MAAIKISTQEKKKWKKWNKGRAFDVLPLLTIIGFPLPTAPSSLSYGSLIDYIYEHIHIHSSSQKCNRSNNNIKYFFLSTYDMDGSPLAARFSVLMVNSTISSLRLVAAGPIPPAVNE